MTLNRCPRFRATWRGGWPLVVRALVAGWIICGCAGRIPAPGERRISPAAEKWLGTLAGQSAAPVRFKGCGRYRLKTADGTFSGRMAWAVIRPDRFRAEILDLTGRPFTTVASDGRWLYADLKAEKKFYKKSGTRALFKHVAGLPATVEEMATLLSGRVPVHAWQAADVGSRGPSADETPGPVLVLKDKWNRRLEEIWFDAATRAPVRMIMYTAAGLFAYQVDFGDRLQREGHAFFRKLSFHNGDGTGLTIRTDRVWPDAELSPAIFTLRNPYP